jgi:lipopolysaccharide transport system permease protein
MNGYSKNERLFKMTSSDSSLAPPLEPSNTPRPQRTTVEDDTAHEKYFGHEHVTVIEPRNGWRSLDLKELWAYRELFVVLTTRDIKVRYKQTVLGFLWAIIQPVMMMIVFSIFFGRLAQMPSDGFPYPIFVYAAILPWTFFANAIGNSGNSLVGSAQLVSKVYFPRLIIPLSSQSIIS